MPDFGTFAAWSSRRQIYLPIPTADLVGFPHKIPIIADAFIGGQAKADGTDIRFVASDGVTELAYERDSWAVAGGLADAIFWVKSAVVVAGTYIWLYYGNAAAADGQNATAVWDANFKAVYHMKDATTSTTLDSTANNNDGAKKAANEPIEAAGKIGKGQDFDGTDDRIKVANHATLQIAGQITLDFWARIDSAPASVKIVVGKSRGLGLVNNYGAYLHDNVLYWDLWTTVRVSNSVSIAGLLNEWHRFSCVYDGTHQKIYIDGAEAKSNNRGSLTLNAAFSGDLYIGNYEDWAAQPFDGLLDEIRVATTGRSAEWIAYEYANMNPADGGLTWGSEEHTATPAGGGKPMNLKLKL